MKSNQKFSLLFWLWRSKASKTDGRAPIYARITIDGLDDELSTSRKVLPEHWDNQLKIVTDPSPEGRKTNKKIIEMRTDLELHFRALQNQFEEVTPGMLKNVYKGIPANGIQENTDKADQSEHTLLEAIDLLIVDFKEQVEEGTRSEQTLKQWRATRQKIIEFARYKSSNDGSIRAIDLQREEDTDPDKFKIWVKSLDSEFGNDFYKYLTLKRRDFLMGTRLKRRPINLLEAAARKQLKNTKQVIDFAVSKKWIASNTMAKFKCSGGDKEVVPLELHEVYQIYEKPMDVVRLEEVRDAFIGQCFTGFAFQDIYALSPDNIVKVGKEGEPWLMKNRGKTKINEMVPILPIVADLIKKYKNHPYCIANNKLFPINCNSRYNGYLKEIAAICGINRKLNTHLARHTFADIMLNNGVPLEDVSKMLGHKNIRTTQRYCRVKKERISRNMSTLRKALFTKTGKLKKIA